MSDELIKVKCDSCGEVIRTYKWESGYGSHSYGHKTLKPYQDVQIQAPEQTYSFKVCQDCLDKDPSSHKLLFQGRNKWFKDKIDYKEKHIKMLYNQIKDIKEHQIPKEQQQLVELKKKYEKFLKIEKIKEE